MCRIKSFSDSHNFFSSACFFDIVHLCLAGFGKIFFTLVLGGTLKSRVSKRYTLASYQIEHPLRIRASLLQQGISEPIFYGDLVYKFKRIVGNPHFSDQFKKIVKRYIRVGYKLDIMRQSACLVLNPITVYSYGFLFNCTTVGQASDSMTALT